MRSLVINWELDVEIVSVEYWFDSAHIGGFVDDVSRVINAILSVSPADATWVAIFRAGGSNYVEVRGFVTFGDLGWEQAPSEV